MTTDSIDPSAPLGNPLVRLRQEGSKWIASSRHGDRWAVTERVYAATAVLAALVNAGFELDAHSVDVLRRLEDEELDRNKP